MNLLDLYELGKEARRTECRVLRMMREMPDEGGLRVVAKSIDVFNFVFRQELQLNGEQVVKAHCNCGAKSVCEHLSAVAAVLMGGTLPDAASVPIFTPAAEPVQPAPSSEPAQSSPVTGPEKKVIIIEPEYSTASVSEQNPVPEAMPAAPQTPESESESAPADSEFQPRCMRIRLGDRAEDGEPVWWMPNDTEQLYHVNTGIIGTMGTGKTQCTKSIITQLWQERGNNYDGAPLGILIFDYKGDYNETKPDFVQAVNARVYKPCRLPYNPLVLNRGRSFVPLLPRHTANRFQDTISRIYHLGPKQKDMLLNSIMDAYRIQGIDEANELTWGRVPPTFETVYQCWLKRSDGQTTDSLAAAMNKLHGFSIFEPDPKLAKPLSQLLQGVMVLDLSQYDSDIQNLVVAITLDQFYAQMQTLGSSRADGRYRQFRSFILVDEADEFMSQGFPSLRRIMKEGREFGVAVLLSTQHLTHFITRKGNDEDYSRYIFTWLVHNVSDLKQRDIEYLFGLKPGSAEGVKLCEQVRLLQKHESLLALGSGTPEKLRDLPFFRLIQNR